MTNTAEPAQNGQNKRLLSTPQMDQIETNGATNGATKIATWATVLERRNYLARTLAKVLYQADTRTRGLTFDIQGIEQSEFVIVVGGQSEVKERLFSEKFDHAVRSAFWSAFKIAFYGADTFNNDEQPPEGWKGAPVRFEAEYVPMWQSLIRDHEKDIEKEKQQAAELGSAESERRKSDQDKNNLLTPNAFAVIDNEDGDQPLDLSGYKIEKADLIKMRNFLEHLIDVL